MERHGLIEVYLLTDIEGEPRQTFHGCNPGDGANADPWTSNPRKIQERWEEAFNKPLKQIEDGMGEGSSAKQSPIMAGVQRIVVERLSDANLDGRLKRLIIASDMMEHTQAFSMYKSGADQAAFDASPARAKFRTPLDGIEVKMVLFQREAAPIAHLPEFWAGWITANKGELASIERLSGAMQ